jgi:hypothetical protein
MPNQEFFKAVFLEEVVFILFGGTAGSSGIGITANGHVIHIPGNNPEAYREVSALVLAAASLAEQAQHVTNAHLSQQMGEFAAEMLRSAAGSLKPLLSGGKNSSQR